MMQTVVTKVATKLPDGFVLELFVGPILTVLKIGKTSLQRRAIEARELLLAFTIIAGLIVGIILPYISPEFLNFLNGFITPTQNNINLSSYISAWFFSHATREIVKLGGDIFYGCKYYDPDYYLTAQRLAELSAKCKIPANEIAAVFKFILEKHDDGISVLHSASGSLDLVLRRFMEAHADTVTEEYSRHRGFYDASVLNDTLQDNARMSALAIKYHVAQEHLAAILNYCLRNLRNPTNSIGSRREDFAQIIADILSGDITVYISFVTQQNLFLTQISSIQQMQERDQRILDRMLLLKIKRTTPPHTTTHNSSPNESFQDALDEESNQPGVEKDLEMQSDAQTSGNADSAQTEHLEELARQLLSRVRNASGPTVDLEDQNVVNAAQAPVDEAELNMLIEFFGDRVKNLTSASSYRPHTFNRDHLNQVVSALKPQLEVPQTFHPSHVSTRDADAPIMLFTHALTQVGDAYRSSGTYSTNPASAQTRSRTRSWPQHLS